MKLPETSAFPTTGKKGGKRKKAGPPAWIFRRKPRICSRKILILPFYGKGIYGKSFWILRSKKPANPHEYWQKRGGHLKCPPQMVGEDGFEPSKRRRNRFTVCPHWPLGNSPIFNKWSWWTDSNPRPADYKSTIRQHFNSKQKPMFLHSLHFQSPIAFTDFANDSERLIIISNVLRFVNT